MRTKKDAYTIESPEIETQQNSSYLMILGDVNISSPSKLSPDPANVTYDVHTGLRRIISALAEYCDQGGRIVYRIFVFKVRSVKRYVPMIPKLPCC
jgi:hypothetical protein